MKNCLIIIALLCFAHVCLSAQEQVGKAAYYSNRYHGAKTYSGEHYNKKAMTCAHKTFPMGTKLKVTRLDNGKSVIVRVNDRMSSNRTIIDLSRAAASKIGLLSSGTAQVKIEVVNDKGEIKENLTEGKKTPKPAIGEHGN